MTKLGVRGVMPEISRTFDVDCHSLFRLVGLQ
eukprot:SAG22_NODE_128_length_18787_cov_19.577108_1_plen_31_part_10